jgi:hypothetical protein
MPVPGAGEHPRVTGAVRPVVAEVQRGVAEVGENVGGLDRGAGVDRRVQ